MSNQSGTVLSGEGEALANRHGEIERIILAKGDSIAHHKYPGRDASAVVLNDSEKYTLHAGDTFAFNGRHHFTAGAAADTVAIHITIRE